MRILESALRAGCAFAVLLASGCATLRTDIVKTPSTALAPAADTPSTRYVRAEIDAHPGQSGFRVLLSNTNALMSRIVMVDHAEHSIDLQYYIFANDATGRLLAQRLLAAADRGVRVRLLLDDLDIEGEDTLLDALDAHPNIDVRLFNPFKLRARSAIGKALQFVFDGRRLNRRMHNKSFIVDGMQAIVGGRNIGDAYFDAGEDIHFRDLDLIAIGTVVPEISSMFDAYWNSESAYPITAYAADHAGTADLDALSARLAADARTFAESDYAQALSDELPNGPSADRTGRWFWGPAELLADDPRKVDPDEDGRTLLIGQQIGGYMSRADKEMLIVSPYFIPGKKGTSYLEAIAARGVAVKVLTNSLAATDEPEVHSGYANYRRELLLHGIDLFELRAVDGERPQHAHGTSSGISLHAKTMVIDRRFVFVGSMNADPRSRVLNTEMGVITDCPPLAAAIANYFDHATSPANAFHVVLQRPQGRPGARAKMVWLATDGDKTLAIEHEPDVSAWTRFRMNLMRLVPIEGLL